MMKNTENEKNTFSRRLFEKVSTQFGVYVSIVCSGGGFWLFLVVFRTLRRVVKSASGTASANASASAFQCQCRRRVKCWHWFWWKL